MVNLYDLGQEHAWSSHQPVIRTIMELYVPLFVLELGVGLYSTPIFLEYKSNLLSVENNKEWIDYMNNIFGKTQILFHDLKDNINSVTLLNELSEEKKEEITSFYKNLNLPELHSNLLFVDQYLSCRLLSIKALYDKFDIIIYHDCHPNEMSLHEYNVLKNIKGFNKYYIISNISWTYLMIRKNIDCGFKILNNNMTLNIEKYKIKYPEINDMKLIGCCVYYI